MTVRRTLLLMTLTLTGVLFLEGCKNENSGSKVIAMIDVKLARRYVPSLLFDSILITPLETISESVLKKFSKIKIHNGNIFIIDYSQRCVFIFNTDGKFMFSTAGKIGMGPGEYTDALSFDINPFTDRIEILEPVSRIATYDLRGEFTGYHYLPPEIIPLAGFEIVTEDLYLFHARVNDYNGKTFLFWSKSRNEVVGYGLVLPKGLDGFPLLNPMPFFKASDNLLFSSDYFSSHVYKIDPIHPAADTAFSFRFPGHRTINDIPAGTSRRDKQSFLTVLSNKYVFPFSPGVMSGFYFIFYYYRERLHFSLTDKSTGKQEVFYYVFGEKYQLPPPQFIDTNGFIYLCDPSHMQYIIDPDLLNESGKRIFERIDISDNPYIVRFCFKNFK